MDNTNNKVNRSEKVQFIELKGQIILLLAIFMALALFTCGFLIGQGNGDVTKFTDKEIERIIELYNVYDDDVTVYRQPDGTILIGVDN